MFKGFGTKQEAFHGIPHLNFQMNNEAYGFSGCTFWLDAAYGLDTQTDLAAVSKWVDRILGISFEQTTAANQPRLVASDGDFNNYPSIDFYSTARRLTTSGYFSMNGGDTLVMICKVTTADTRGNALFYGNGLNDQHICLRADGAGGGHGVFSNLNTSPKITYVDSTIIDVAPHIVIMTNSDVVVDGVLTSSGYNWTPSTAYQNLSSTSGSIALQSKVAEVIKYSQKLSTNKMIELCDNINSKYLIY